MPAPAAQTKKTDAFSRGRLRPANRTWAKKQDGIINPTEEEMYGRKHSTEKHEKRWMDSGDRSYCQLCHVSYEVRLCCFSQLAQLVDTYEKQRPELRRGDDSPAEAVDAQTRPLWRCHAIKASHPEHNNPIQNTWVTQGDHGEEADAQVRGNMCRLQMDSWGKTISLVSDHCGLWIALLIGNNKTRAHTVKVWGLRSVTVTESCN